MIRSSVESAVRLRGSRIAVVGIVASSGGLRAIAAVLDGLPASFEPSILVVQHRAPAYSALLPRLLSQRTQLPVCMAADGQSIDSGHVYVAPSDMQLLATRAHRLVLAAPQPGTFPLRRCTGDRLFLSLADAYGSTAVAVVLSGGLSDGAEGVRAIKHSGGIVLAQDQTSAYAFGMPRAAIATGVVDAVVPLDSMAALLVELARVGAE